MTDDPFLNAVPDDPPWTRPRLNTIPGTGLVGPDDWIMVSDTHSAQMALRARLVAERPGEVLGQLPGAEPAIAELYGLLLGTLARRDDYELSDTSLTRPDGVTVLLGGPDLSHIAHLVQEDFCILTKQGGEYVLIAAVLCFPMFWLLSEKLGRGMDRIHAPVEEYDAVASKRVARLFDGIRPGLPITRENGHRVHTTALFTPESEARHHGADQPDRASGQFWRSERQSLVRLPDTGAVLFSIHTRLWPISAIT